MSELGYLALGRPIIREILRNVVVHQQSCILGTFDKCHKMSLIVFLPSQKSIHDLTIVSNQLVLTIVSNQLVIDCRWVFNFRFTGWLSNDN